MDLELQAIELRKMIGGVSAAGSAGGSAAPEGRSVPLEDGPKIGFNSADTSSVTASGIGHEQLRDVVSDLEAMPLPALSQETSHHLRDPSNASVEDILGGSKVRDGT